MTTPLDGTGGQAVALELLVRSVTVSRRALFVIALCAALLLPPGTAVAQDQPSPSPAPSLPVATTPAMGESPAASPSPSLLPATVQPTPTPLPALDFQVGKWKLRRLDWEDRRLNGGKVLALETDGPQDANGVPRRPLGRYGRLVYNPTVLAQQGMKRLDSYQQTGNRYHLRQARKYANTLLRISDGGKRRRWQPHWYDMGPHEYGWVNSNSHGLVLSFLSRYYQLMGATKRLEQARQLFNAFLNRPDNDRWFSLVTPAGYIWFEHWPEGRHDHTLNAHMNALFGLYDYWLATGDPLAEQYILGGAKTVRDKLYRFRRKDELSRYSISTSDGSLHYHETHIEQLRILADITGDAWFDRQADVFERDEAAWKAKYRGARPREDE